MKNLDEFISSLKELADEAPMTAVVLPPKTAGFPVGTYNLKILLIMIAENLDGHPNLLPPKPSRSKSERE